MRINNQKSFFFLIFLSIIGWSCNQMEDRIKLPDCHNRMTLDSLQTENELIGEWEWIFIRCFSDPGNGDDYSYRGLTIEFKSNHTLIVKKEGEVIKTSSWTLKDRLDGSFSLEADPSVSQLSGIISICEDLISFNASYYDLCDNYFKSMD